MSKDLKVEEVAIPEHIINMDWATLRGYASDLDVNIKGLKRPTIELLVMEAELDTEVTTPSSDEDDYQDTISGLTNHEKLSRLVRCTVYNLCPHESALQSVVWTIGNELEIGLTRVIQFGQITHIPSSMAKSIKDATYSRTVQHRNKLGAITNITTKQEKHYRVEIHRPLTTKELDDLAKEQRASGRLAELEG